MPLGRRRCGETAEVIGFTSNSERLQPHQRFQQFRGIKDCQGALARKPANRLLHMDTFFLAQRRLVLLRSSSSASGGHFTSWNLSMTRRALGRYWVNERLNGTHIRANPFHLFPVWRRFLKNGFSDLSAAPNI